MQHYNDSVTYLKPQPYLCTDPLIKGMELIMQLRADEHSSFQTMTAEFGRQSASRQSARRVCCKSCDLGPDFGDEAETSEHSMLDCLVYQAQRQKLWEKLTSDHNDVAAQCQMFWMARPRRISCIVYGPFKHAVKCIAKYVSAAWKLGVLVLTIMMWHDVKPMGFVTEYRLRLGLYVLLVFHVEGGSYPHWGSGGYGCF